MSERVHPSDLRPGDQIPHYEATVISSVSGNNETRISFQRQDKPFGELDRIVCWGHRDSDNVQRLLRN